MVNHQAKIQAKWEMEHCFNCKGFLIPCQAAQCQCGTIDFLYLIGIAVLLNASVSRSDCGSVAAAGCILWVPEQSEGKQVQSKLGQFWSSQVCAPTM